MRPLLLGAAWASVVVVAAWRHRPVSATATVVSGEGARPRAPAGAVLGQGVALVGRALRRRLGRPADAAADRRLGWALLAAGAGVPASPLLGAALASVAWSLPVIRRRSEARRHEARVLGALPEVVDLFVVAVGAGLTVPLALRAVAVRAPPPFSPALSEVARQASLGGRLADLLDGLPAVLGDAVRPLTAALAASERYGAPLVASLDRLAGEVRRDRRRRAETVARRIPVKLLFPLVLLVLPSFALLTLAPLVAGALRALRL